MYKTAEESVVNYGQILIEMSDDFCKTAEHLNSQHLMDIGDALYETGVRMATGIQKTAATGENIEWEYADIAADLNGLAHAMDDLYKEASDNEVLGTYIDDVASICDIITEDVGVEKVAELVIEKRAADDQGGFLDHFRALKQSNSNHLSSLMDKAKAQKMALTKHHGLGDHRTGGGVSRLRPSHPEGIQGLDGERVMNNDNIRERRV